MTTYRRVSDLLVPPHFPDPEELLWLPDEDLLRAGVWTNKLETLRGLARACLDGTLDPSSLAGLSDEEVIRSLTRVRGIGPWTAKMYLIFRLGRLDVMAEDDIGLRRGLQSLIGSPSRPPPSELLARSQAWRLLRSVASWYLWRYDDLHSSARSTLPRSLHQRA